jgi:hexosaminidase
MRTRLAALTTMAIGMLSQGPVAGVEPNIARRDFLLRWDLPSTEPAARLTIENHSARTLESSGWSLYFNCPEDIAADHLPPSLRLQRVNGDFYRLEPGPGFAPVPPGGALAVTLQTHERLVNTSDVPAGFYFVFGEQPLVEQTDIRPRDEPSGARIAAARFAQDQDVTAMSPEQLAAIVPSPRRVVRSPGEATLGRSAKLHVAPGFELEAAYLQASLRTWFDGAPPATDASVDITLARASRHESWARGDGEAYRLDVSPTRGITITAAGSAGVFYGIESLRALVDPAAYRGAQTTVRVPVLSIEDAPRFPYRGLLLDVARNFQPKSALLKLLDLMAFYKLNTLHLHLSDDEGWRLAIASLPELTDVGARRGHTTDERDHLVPSFGSGPDPATVPGSGHYSRADFVEILRYAHARHIAVVPEVDMPGHSRAAIVAMRARHDRLRSEGRAREADAFRLDDPDDQSRYRSIQGWTDNVMNVCQPSTLRFIAAVVDDVRGMYAEAEAPLTAFHIGGDEIPAGAWERSPACTGHDGKRARDASELRRRFVRHVSGLLRARGLQTAGWQEIAGAAREIRAHVWNIGAGGASDDMAYRLANGGADVVLGPATDLYFDQAYDDDPSELGQHWAGFVDTRKAFLFAPGRLCEAARNAKTPCVALQEKARRHLLGIQGHLWGELAKDPGTMEYLLFPKLLGLAERGWAQTPEWETTDDAERRDSLRAAAWNDFANRVGQRELPRLSFLAGGVQYRVSPPGAVIDHGRLKTSVAFPGLITRFTTDGSEPTAASTAYTDAVAVQGTVKLKTFTSTGRASRTTIVESEMLQ